MVSVYVVIHVYYNVIEIAWKIMKNSRISKANISQVYKGIIYIHMVRLIINAQYRIQHFGCSENYSVNKTERHYKTELLLTVALNNNNNYNAIVYVAPLLIGRLQIFINFITSNILRMQKPHAPISTVSRVPVMKSHIYIQS